MAPIFFISHDAWRKLGKSEVCDMRNCQFCVKWEQFQVNVTVPPVTTTDNLRHIILRETMLLQFT